MPWNIIFVFWILKLTHQGWLKTWPWPFIRHQFPWWWNCLQIHMLSIRTHRVHCWSTSKSTGGHRLTLVVKGLYTTMWYDQDWQREIYFQFHQLSYNSQMNTMYQMWVYLLFNYLIILTCKVLQKKLNEQKYHLIQKKVYFRSLIFFIISFSFLTQTHWHLLAPKYFPVCQKQKIFLIKIGELDWFALSPRDLN